MNQNVNGSDSAHFAQFARPKFEMKTKGDHDGSPVFPSFVYEHLPKLLKNGCEPLKTERQRDVFLTGALTILSGCFKEVQGLYDGKIVNANLYSIIVAPPASDKSALNLARTLGMGIHKRCLLENEQASKAYKRDYAKYKATCKFSKDPSVVNEPPEETTTKLLFIPGNSSSAAIMKHIKQNNGGGIICETEADTLTNTFKQDWGNFDDLLRKGFHQETFSSSRVTNNELLEIQRPKPAVALSGTPAQASRLLVSSENGLFSRFLCYYFKSPSVWRDVSPKANINLDDYYNTLSERVYELYENLMDMPIEIQLPEDIWQVHNEFFASNLSSADQELTANVKRLGLMVFKMAMVLTILRNEEKIPTDGKLTCDPVDYRIAYLLYQVYQEHSELVYHSLLRNKDIRVDTSKMKFLEALPIELNFTRKEALEVGKALPISERQVDKYLKLLCFEGTLELVRYGNYIKK